MCEAGGSATWASAVTGGAVRGGWMPSRWAQRCRMIGSSSGTVGRPSSAINSSLSGSRAPSAATRRTRWATVRPVTKYVLPASWKVLGGSPRNPAQSSTDLALPLSGPRTRQVSCRVTSGTVNPGTGVPSRSVTRPSSPPGAGRIVADRPGSSAVVGRAGRYRWSSAGGVGPAGAHILGGELRGSAAAPPGRSRSRRAARQWWPRVCGGRGRTAHVTIPARS